MKRYAHSRSRGSQRTELFACIGSFPIFARLLILAYVFLVSRRNRHFQMEMRCTCDVVLFTRFDAGVCTAVLDLFCVCVFKVEWAGFLVSPIRPYTILFG